MVHGSVRPDHGVIEAPLGPAEHSQVAIKDQVRLDGAAASTEFAVQTRFARPEGKFSLLKLTPLTGRKHQIRIHLAHFGHPIVGDKLYGGDENLYLDFVRWQLSEAQRRVLILPNHALHAGGVRFAWRGAEILFRAPPESWFTAFRSQSELGGV